MSLCVAQLPNNFAPPLSSKETNLIKPTRSNLSSNMHRFYATHLAPTLFGQWGLVREWGHIGSPGQVREQLSETEPAAQPTLTKKVRIKARRDYILAL